MAFGEFDFARVSRSRNEVKADIINSVAKLANTLLCLHKSVLKSQGLDRRFAMLTIIGLDSIISTMLLNYIFSQHLTTNWSEHMLSYSQCIIFLLFWCQKSMLMIFQIHTSSVIFYFCDCATAGSSVCYKNIHNGMAATTVSWNTMCEGQRCTGFAIIRLSK